MNNTKGVWKGPLSSWRAPANANICGKNVQYVGGILPWCHHKQKPSGMHIEKDIWRGPSFCWWKIETSQVILRGGEEEGRNEQSEACEFFYTISKRSCLLQYYCNLIYLSPGILPSTALLTFSKREIVNSVSECYSGKSLASSDGLLEGEYTADFLSLAYTGQSRDWISIQNKTNSSFSMCYRF